MSILNSYYTFINSVEVVYGDEEPSSPPPTPTKLSASSIPGRGPTGRTPNQTSQKNQPRRGKSPQKNPKSSKQKSGKSSSSGPDQDENTRKSPSKTVPGERGMVRSTSSHSHHSQSYGDTDEWEDCTESSGVDELQVECRLNPEAPEFLPTSPDFMKTPPGHIKCLNWTAGVGSPTSSLSQGSVNSPRFPANYSGNPPSKNNSPKSTTSSSSPGSSVSQKGSKRPGEMDNMPMKDEPHPPPFVLDAVVPKEKSPKPKGNKRSDGKKNKDGKDEKASKNKSSEKGKSEVIRNQIYSNCFRHRFIIEYLSVCDYILLTHGMYNLQFMKNSYSRTQNHLHIE